MERTIELVMLSELIVEKLEDIKEHRTRAESVALSPYVKQMTEVNNELLPALLLESTLFNFLTIPIKKIGQEINLPVKDGLEAQKRLQNIYNLFRPFVDYLSTNMGVIDKQKEQDLIDGITPKDIIDDLEKLNNNLKMFMELRPSIIAVTDRDSAITAAEAMIKQMETNGASKEKIQHMKDVLEKAIKE